VLMYTWGGVYTGCNQDVRKNTTRPLRKGCSNGDLEHLQESCSTSRARRTLGQSSSTTSLSAYLETEGYIPAKGTGGKISGTDVSTDCSIR
jgi:hypothetical protein